MTIRNRAITYVLILFAAIIPLILSGCSGGEGSAGSISAGSEAAKIGSPTVVGTDPADGALDVPLNQTISVTFTEPMEALATAKWNAISVKKGDVVVPIEKSIDGAVLILDPVPDLEAGQTYTVTVPKESVGAIAPPEENNAGGRPLKKDFIFTFTTGGTVVPIAPVVTGSDPVQGATGIALEKTITVTFDEEIAQGDNWSGIALKQGVSPVPVNVSIGPDEKVLIVDPTGDLASDCSFTLTVPAGAVKDKATLTAPLETEFALDFQTGGAPSLVSTDPTDGAVNIPLSKTITVTFSETVLEGTYFSGISLTDGINPVPFAPSINGNVLTIDPVDDLVKYTTYTVNIPAGAVIDETGFALAAPETFSFTTADPPVVTGSDPLDGTFNVALDKTATVTFSKDIQQDVNWTGITLKAGSVVVPTTNGISGNVLSVNPVSSLAEDTVYTVEIPAAAVKSVDGGNSLSEPCSFSFTTGYPPQWVNNYPANNASNVPTNTAISVTFDENILPASNWDSITLKAGATPIAMTKEYQGNTLYITPASKLMVRTTYTVNVPAGAVKDTVGNVTTAGYSFSFTTNNVFFFENFSNGIPATWTIVDGYNDGLTWTAVDPGTYNIGSPFTNPCGIIDSRQAGAAYMDEQLVTPTIDISNSAGGQIQLQFANCFAYYVYGMSEVADVDVSTNGGVNWINVLRMVNASYGPETRVINVTAQASGQSAMIVRYHYYNARSEYWWLIDDVKVYETP